MEIQIINLKKTYQDSTVALDGLSCAITSGQIVGLVGPNGAGKSTLLKAIAGLLSFDGGAISIKNDINLGFQTATYIPERPDLFPLLSVWEHFKYMGIAYGLNNWQLEAGDLLLRFNLTEKKNAFACELSKGMQQKLMLAISLLRKAKIVLMDEPFEGLDPGSVIELRNIISELKSPQRIIVVSSHNLNSIYRLSDKVMIINRGQLIRYQDEKSIMQEMKEKNYTTLEDLFLEVTSSDGS